MDADAVIALARANGVEIVPEAAERIASVLKPTLTRLNAVSARTEFDAEPATLVKVLRP